MMMSIDLVSLDQIASYVSELLVWAYLFSVGYFSLWVYQRVSVTRLDLDSKQVAALSLVSGGVCFAVGVVIYFESTDVLPPLVAASVALLVSIFVSGLLGGIPAFANRPRETVSWEPTWSRFADHYELETAGQAVVVLLNNGMKITGNIHRINRVSFGPPSLMLDTEANIEHTQIGNGNPGEGRIYTEETDGKIYIPASAITALWVSDD